MLKFGLRCDFDNEHGWCNSSNGELLLPSWLKHLELNCRNSHEVVMLPEDIDLPLIVHAPDPTEDKQNFIEVLESCRKNKKIFAVNTHARPEDEFTLCYECGVRIINLNNLNQVCPWCDSKLDPEWQIGKNLDNINFSSVVETLQEGADLLSKSNITLLVENTFESPHIMLKLFSVLPDNCFFTLDLGHAHINSENPIDYIFMLRDKLRHLHLHDNDGGKIGLGEIKDDQHKMPGEGNIPWNVVRKCLKNISYNFSATFEVYYEPKLDTWINEFEK